MKRFFSAPIFEDEEQTRIAELLNIIVLTALGLNIFNVVYYTWIKEPDVWLVYVLTLILVSMELGALSMMRHGYVRQAGLLFITIFWLMAVGLVFRYGGTRGSYFTLLLCVSVVGGLILGNRVIALFAVLSMLVGGGVVYAELQGWQPIKQNLMDSWFNQSFNFVLISLVLYLTNRSIKTAMARIQRNEHELAESNRELRDIHTFLEEWIAQRTRRLETIALLGERLSAILNLDQLLVELVKQLKQNFGYDKAQVYLVDEARQYLRRATLPDAMGNYDSQTIRFDAVTNLIAQAARTGEISQEADAPSHYTTLAVPIILNSQVVGVLEIQEDKVVTLDKSEANLLRSLANHVAIAIRNARLFTEVETALAEAHIAQERYIVQSWHKSNIAPENQACLYVCPSAPPLDEKTMATAKQLALAQQQPTMLSISGKDTTLVAPVIFLGKTIGALQVHRLDADNAWAEQDLTMVKVILDQMAQAAENIRLFEETKEKAAREQAIREITNKLRQTSNLSDLLETAAQELGQRLQVRHVVMELGVKHE